jgi:hypothetical protein
MEARIGSEELVLTPGCGEGMGVCGYVVCRKVCQDDEVLRCLSCVSERPVSRACTVTRATMLLPVEAPDGRRSW